MKYRIELVATAKADIREIARWLRDRTSPAVADRWMSGLDRAIRTLEARPQRCPVAAESLAFPEEIRELAYGRSKSGKYRIIFTVRDESVYVLYIRHTARDELQS